MSKGINGILLRLAQSALEKQAQGEGFVPAPPPGAGGMPPMGGGAGGPPMGPGADPAMLAAAQGMPPAEMMAQMGGQVDPAMAAAGGASVPPPPMPGGDPMAAAGGAPPIDPAMQAAIDSAVQKAMGGAPGANGGGKGGAKNQMQADIAEIKGLLNKVLGVMVGAGKLPATELGDVGNQPGEGVPPEQKAAHHLGSVADEVPAANMERISNSLAELIISLRG